LWLTANAARSWHVRGPSRRLDLASSTEVEAGHLAIVTHSDLAVDLIEQAALGAAGAA
jgi:hypothetical protein